MDSSKSIKTIYQIDYSPLYILIGFLAILLTSSSVAYLLIRRKRKPRHDIKAPVEPKPIDELEKKDIKSIDKKHCIFCGEEIPKIAEYCERCGKKVKLE